MLTGNFNFNIKRGHYYYFVGNEKIANGRYNGLQIVVGKNFRGVDCFDIHGSIGDILNVISSTDINPVFHKIEQGEALQMMENGIFTMQDYYPDPRYCYWLR